MYEIHPAALFIPEMPQEQYESLVCDIRENGLLVPIELYKGRVIDGRHRQRACEELGITPEYVETELQGLSPNAYVKALNLRRRHLTPSQIASYAVDDDGPLEAERAAAKERQRESGGDRRSQAAKSVVQKVVQPIGRDLAADRVAKVVGTNREYLRQAEMIKEKSPALLEEVKAGNITLPRAVQQIKRAEAVAKLQDIAVQEAKELAGVYDVVVIDPPWPMEKIERDVTPEQVAFEYPTMQEAELAAMELPLADDCHAWVWTTHRFLPMCLRLLGAWNLKYVCTFVWHKPGGFQPFGLPQYNCEFAVYARRGKPQFVDVKAFPVCFNAPRGAHSEKPEEFYELLRRVTAGRRLDMFNRRQIEGFDTWGNEAK